MSWPLGKVSDIAEVISGFAFKSEWFGHGSSKVIRIGDLQDGRIDVANAEIFDALENKVRDQFLIKRNDILMALSGATVGKIAVADDSAEGAYLNQRVAIIRGNNSENSEYLKYVFSGHLLKKLLLKAGGAAQPNLSPKDLGEMEIPLPPLAEQKRIAAILDKADAIRRKRQQAIQLADEFLRAVFLDMFGDPVTNPKGWDERSADEIAPISPLKAQQKEDKVWLLNLDQIEQQTGKLLHKVFVQPSEVGSSTVWFNENYVLYSKLRPYLNKVLLPDELGVGTSELLALLPSKEILNKDYLAEYLKSDRFVAWANTKVAGAKMPRLSTSEFKKHKIMLPPIELQLKFAKIKGAVKSSLKQSEDFNQEMLFESLSQKAFKGEL